MLSMRRPTLYLEARKFIVGELFVNETATHDRMFIILRKLPIRPQLTRAMADRAVLPAANSDRLPRLVFSRHEWT